MFSVPTKCLDCFQEEMGAHSNWMCWYKYIELVVWIAAETEALTQVASISRGQTWVGWGVNFLVTE